MNYIKVFWCKKHWFPYDAFYPNGIKSILWCDWMNNKLFPFFLRRRIWNFCFDKKMAPKK